MVKNNCDVEAKVVMVDSARDVERPCGVRSDVVELPLSELRSEKQYWVDLTASSVWLDLGSTMVSEGEGGLNWL